MATANKALKKRAQAFAEDHELSYLRALKAVDEPLHALRDLTDPDELNRLGYHRHFELVSDSRTSPAPTELLTVLTEYTARNALLRESEAADIWSYRELHRAGLLASTFQPLEPAFCYYGQERSSQVELAFLSDPKLGIFCVGTADSAHRGDKKLIPATEEQLDALRRGDTAERIELPSSAIEVAASADLGSREDSARSIALENCTVDALMELVASLMPLSSTRREIALLAAREVVAEGRGTLRQLVAELRSLPGESRRDLGNRINIELSRYQRQVSNYGLDRRTRPVKARIDALNELAVNTSPHIVEVPENPQGSATTDSPAEEVNIFELLQFDSEEILAAEREVDFEADREHRIRLIIELGDTLEVVASTDQSKLWTAVRDEVSWRMHQREEVITEELLTAVIRGLRASDDPARSKIGSAFLRALLAVQGKPKERDIAELVRTIGLSPEELQRRTKRRGLLPATL